MSEGLELPHQKKVFTMLGALLGLLLAALDQTLVATAGPRMQKDLHIEAGLYVWITTAYLVASTVMIPIYGKLSDLYGRRRVLLISIGIFLAGSVACGLSQDATQLIAFRAVQGIGSAGLFTSAFAVVADLFAPAERGKWQGMFGAAFGVSSVIGPLLGGFITDNFGWHWAFFINLPIGLVAVSFILSQMPPLRSEALQRKRLDVAGALALGVATLPLLLALSFGHAASAPQASGWPWLSWQILALFGTSLAGAVVFVWIELRAESPIIDLRLFEIKTVAIGSLAAFVVGASFLGAIVFLPVFMVNVVGASATSAGLTTTPLTFGIVFANITSGQLVSRIGKYKGLLVGSLVVQVVAFVLLALTIDLHATRAGVSWKMVVLGIGLGPSIPLFTLAVQTAVPLHQIGVATATVTFFRQMGGTIGLAIVGTIFATSFAGTLAAQMPAATAGSPEVAAMMQQHAGGGGGEGDPRATFDPAAVKAALDPHIPDSRREAAHTAIDSVGHVFKVGFTDALVRAFWACLAIAILGLVITLLLPALPLRGGGPAVRAVD